MMDWDSDKVEIISYAEIFQRTRTFDRSVPIAVSLSRYQAWLFRSKFEILTRAGETEGLPLSLYGLFKLLFVTALIMFTAPALAFLSDFYVMTTGIQERIRFVTRGADVLVYFFPNRSDKGSY